MLSPTRELAEQIQKELSPLLATRQRKSVSVYGGVGYGAQRQALRKGVDVLVACPGRLEDLIGPVTSSSTRSRSSSSTRPTGWPTWASCPP